MPPIARLAAVVAFSAFTGFTGTTALRAKSPQIPAITPETRISASLPLHVILIMQDAMTVRTEHDRRPP